VAAVLSGSDFLPQGDFPVPSAEEYHITVCLCDESLILESGPTGTD
jgi:hypothetical protein